MGSSYCNAIVILHVKWNQNLSPNIYKYKYYVQNLSTNKRVFIYEKVAYWYEGCELGDDGLGVHSNEVAEYLH